MLRQRSGQGYSAWEVHRRNSFIALLGEDVAPQGGAAVGTDANVLASVLDLALAHLTRTSED
jgi:hypothetical protein